jgi:putative membrane protein
MTLPPFDPHWDTVAVAVALEGGYLWAVRRLAPRALAPGERAVTRRQLWAYTLGVLTLFVAAEWPIHDLSEHYLFSVHMFQHTLISLVAPPLMLLGMPEWLLRRLLRPRALNWLVRTFARPFIALVVFNVVIIATHWPAAVNAMLTHHWLHFFGHAALFVSATLMWWPVVGRLPEMPTLSYPGKMVYLFLQSIVPTVPASFLTFGSTPLYHFYSTVPRLWGMSVITDQRVAGLLMKLLGGAILWSVIAVIFFRWYAQELGSDGWDALQWRDVEREVHTELTKR